MKKNCVFEKEDSMKERERENKRIKEDRREEKRRGKKLDQRRSLK